MYEHLGYILPEIWIVVAICLVLSVSVFRKNIDSHWPALITKLSIIVAILLVFDQYDQPATPVFNNLYMIDSVSTVLKLCILTTSLIAFVYSRNYVLMRKLPETEYYVLGLFSILGMMVITSSYTLLMIYLGMELMSLPLYAMVALQKDKQASVEASIKYFVMGAIASGLMLYGMSILYAITGKIDLVQINMALRHVDANTYSLVVFAMIFVIAGIGFKLAAVPFHMWAPDVYEGAPSSVAMLIASAPKIAAVGMIIRLIADGLLPILPQTQVALVFISVMSMFLGNLIAISQNNIKRMLGYSAVAHAGYLLLSMIPGTPYGFSSAMFYIIVYAFTTALTFGGIVLLSHYDIEIESLTDLKGLNRRSPWIAFMMLISFFSLAGVPPTAGFFAKLLVLRALVLEGWVWLAVLALIFAIIGSFYYLRVIRLMYFEEPAEEGMPVLSLDSKLVMSVNGLLILGLGIFPSYLWFYCQSSFA